MTLESQADFARRQGIARSRVTAYKNAGRLVMEGDKVNVESSIARINATRDGARDHQSPRHPSAGGAGQGDEAPLPPIPTRIDAQARKEHLAAELLQIDLDERRGKLLVAADVASVLADAATTLRTRLESLPETLAPQLAPVADEQQIRALLADHIETALGELVARINGMGQTT